jgi:glycosyltransferase involved in cell wall biosynthesis
MRLVALPGFHTLSIVVPMWNEERYAERLVAAALRLCADLVASGQVADYELLIVDDASTDGTPALLQALAAQHPKLRVVRHAVNRKLGGSLKTGFAHAVGDLVLYTDADLPFDLNEVKKAIRLMSIYEADVIAAYRHDRTSEGLRRTVYSFAYNWLLRVAFGLLVRDVNFAFKLLRRPVLEAVALESEGSFIDAELLIQAERLGYTVLQFGVDYFPRVNGNSTLSSVPVIIKILEEGVRAWPRLRALRGERHRAPPAAGPESPGRPQ